VPPFSIALASYEVWPFVPGGGLGRAIWSNASLLAEHGAQVTILTSERFRAEHDRLKAAGSQRLPANVRLEFAKHPEGDVAPFRTWHHAWSASLYRRLTEIAPPGGFDVVEFPDYGGSATVAVQARRTADPALARTLVAVRLHTSHEMTTVLDSQPETEHSRFIRAMERLSLRFADRLLWPGGDVLSGYERFYGADALARASRLPLHFVADAPAPEDAAPPDPSGPLRLLYFGRFQRLKGVDHLVRAVRALGSDRLRLTMVGGDTDTGPAHTSMRAFVARLAAGDPRIEFHDRVAIEELPALIRAHHLVVIPSLWECFAYVAYEALACNRPILGSSVGPIPALVEPGHSGWLVEEPSEGALVAAIAELLRRREEIDALIVERRPRATLERQLDPAAIVADYRKLADDPRTRIQTRRWKAARVSALVRISDRGGPLSATLASLSAQGLPMQIVAVAERLPPVRLVARISDLVHLPGVDGARALRAGLDRCVGDYVVFLEAGDILKPTFVSEALGALEANPDLSYVTSFADGRSPFCAPIGNWVIRAAGVDPTTAVMVGRRAAVAAGPPDTEPGDESRAWLADLAERGRFGAVLPESLIAHLHRRHRWRRDRSMPAPSVPPRLWTVPAPRSRDGGSASETTQDGGSQPAHARDLDQPRS
jgi:glycosyltransferase involved in cell wall biosynthesis